MTTPPDSTQPEGRRRLGRRWQRRAIFGVGLLGLVAITVWAIVGAFGGSDAPGADGAEQLAASEHGTVTPLALPDGCPPAADACVNTRLRVSWLQHDGRITYGPVPVMPGSEGKPGAEVTPQGVFHVEWKDAKHVSDEFNEPMPNAVFFAPGGVAFHEGSLTSSSHGCVHLSWQDSKVYFDRLPVGAEVAVFGGQAPPS